VWQKQLHADYGYPAGGLRSWMSRTSLAVYGNEVIFGDNNATGFLNLGVGANVLAVNARTGAPLWKTRVDSDPAAVITANPLVAGGKVIVGVSSNEEGVGSGLYGPYACCTFRGKVVALNASTGAMQWSTLYRSVEHRHGRLEPAVHGIARYGG
jgi:polyvinyl alcohol dehydrogenase (cytochrome)